MSVPAFPADDPEAAKAWWRAQPARIAGLIEATRLDVRRALRISDKDEIEVVYERKKCCAGSCLHERVPSRADRNTKDCLVPCARRQVAGFHLRKIAGLREVERIMAGERIRCQFSVAQLVETNRVRI